MKPTRRRLNLLPGGLSREQQLGLMATALLLVLLSGLVFYQQFGAPVTPIPLAPTPDSTGAESQPKVPTGEAGGTAPNAPGSAANGSGTGLTEAVVEPVRPDRLSPPLQGDPVILQAFGSLDQSYGDYRLADAIAYRATKGQAVTAAAKGRVVAIEEDPIQGRSLWVDHGGGLTSRYAGLGALFVGLDGEVEEGATIAEVGAPGPLRQAFGPHLLFGVELDQEPIDPTRFFKP